MTYGHLQADCLYTGISSGPSARYRLWEAFTFTLFLAIFVQRLTDTWASITQSVVDEAIDQWRVWLWSLRASGKAGGRHFELCYNQPVLFRAAHVF